MGVDAAAPFSEGSQSIGGVDRDYGVAQCGDVDKSTQRISRVASAFGEFGRDHMFRGKREAFNQVFQNLDRSICATCTARIFQECATIEGPKPA